MLGNQPVPDGILPLYVSAQWMVARPTCLRLFVHERRAAASRTFCTAGSRSPIKTAIMAITTSNSIRVKPRQRLKIRRDGMENFSKRYKDNKRGTSTAMRKQFK